MVLRGARQVGKSTLIDEFAKEFDYYVQVDLEKEHKDLFDRFEKVEQIWEYLCLLKHIPQDKTKRYLLFIDEIQENVTAVAKLRYFYEDMPWLYVIAAGSRLQTLIKKKVSFPVGRVEYFNLRPFSFLEYINASEGEEWAQMLRTVSVPQMLHQDFIDRFNTYALVGGMPEVVSAYINNPDVESLAPIYNSLLTGYNEDVQKYSKNKEEVRILQHILSTAWYEAGNKITFSKFGNSSYSSTRIHSGMEVLEKAFVLSLDYPCTSTSAPAVPAKKRSPKLIMVDSGITNFVADIQVEYLRNKDLLDTWRGRAAEQIVAQELRVVLDRNYKSNQLFWVREKNGTTAEIDFIWQYKSQIIPIEVKSGHNSHLKSLHSFVNNSDTFVTAIRIWGGEFFVQDALTPAPESKPYRIINLPFYYAGQIDTIIKQYL